MTKHQFKVIGMHCVSCAMMLEGALEDLQGVGSANASYAKSQVLIEYDERQVTLIQLAQAAQSVGYQLQTSE
jgi:Cu+-exporting ATPase